MHQASKGGDVATIRQKAVMIANIATSKAGDKSNRKAKGSNHINEQAKAVTGAMIRAVTRAMIRQ